MLPEQEWYSFLSVRCNKICSVNLLALFNCSSKLIQISYNVAWSTERVEMVIQTCTHKHTKHIQYCPPFLHALKGTLAFLRGGRYLDLDILLLWKVVLGTQSCKKVNLETVLYWLHLYIAYFLLLTCFLFPNPNSSSYLLQCHNFPLGINKVPTTTIATTITIFEDDLLYTTTLIFDS